jgi:hypothetical protein
MNTTIRAAAVATAVAFALTACDTGQSSEAARVNKAAGHSQAPADDSPTSSPSQKPPAAPHPKASYTHNCDYQLGNFTTGGPGGMRFTADSTVHNTGNVGAVIKLTGTWFLSGGRKVTHAKLVRVARGKSARVGFWVPATQDQISSYQSVDEGSNYDGSACKVTASITDTFGKVQ